MCKSVVCKSVGVSKRPCVKVLVCKSVHVQKRPCVKASMCKRFVKPSMCKSVFV